jgi:hypothetical protein
MKKIILISFLFIYTIATAQKPMGESIFKYMYISGEKILENEVENEITPKIDFPKNSNGSTLKSKSERMLIGHYAPTPFIAFSCKWKPLDVDEMQLRIRFSTSDNNSENGFEKIIADQHFENNEGYKASQLIFVDKKYTHFEIEIIAINIKSANILNEFKLNFFNPGKENKQPLFSNFSLLNNAIVSNTNQNNSIEKTTACPCTLPNYITRTQWNCPQGQGLVPAVGTSTTVTHLIVHHSAGNNTATDWNAVVLSIWNLHTGTNGYSDIGYNWLIAPNGVLYEGRGSNSLTQNVTGAHFCGTNAATMGTCMIGTYTSADVSTTARTTLTNLLAWKACQAGIQPIGTALHASSGLTLNRISGHRDGCATECPGTQFYNTFPTLRTQVEAAIMACNTVAPCTASLKISTTGCPNNNLIFTPTNIVNGGTTPTYAWYVNNVFVTNGNTFNLTNAKNGDQVFAKMTSNAACANPNVINSDTATVSCILVTAITLVDGVEKFEVFPNPSNGNFNVLLNLTNQAIVSYKLYDAKAQTVFVTAPTKQIGKLVKQFNVANLSKGVYWLETTINSKKMIAKILVEN